MLYISMRVLISPHLMQITNCFAALICGSKWNTPLIHAGFKNNYRFRSRSSNFCNFTPRLHQKRSQKVRNPNFSLGTCPQTPPPPPPSRHTMCTLITYWGPSFQNPKSAIVVSCSCTSLKYKGLPFHVLSQFPSQK